MRYIPDAPAGRINDIFWKLEDHLYEHREVSAGVVSQSKHMLESNLVNKNKG